ncbi:hypothetical protein NHJ6243_004443 [Beauveria neobassiana]
MNATWVDDSDDDVYVRSRHRRQRQRLRSASVASTSTILPSTADEDDDFCEIIEEDDAEADVLFASEVIDLTEDESQRLILPHRPNETELDSITFGITHAKHINHFWALIRDFTDLGYSVRWSVIRLCTWGSPQDRKRLIMIASAPGEQSPSFPAPTHSEFGGNGTKPFNTVASTIARVRMGDNLHNPEDVQTFHPPRPSWDANTLGRTITTGGANSYHPSGRRDFTLRELACLQGFPKSHRFVGTWTKIRRQIGNAFPPNTVYVLYKHLHDWLLKEDKIDSYIPEDNTMVIDDDESDISGSESVIFGEARVSPAIDDVFMGQSDDEVIFVGTNADCDDDCFVDLT